jgi:hypothetical protein
MDGFRLLLAYCVLVAFAQSTNLDLGLKIALHAQSKSSLHGWVAGSEVTTRGLRRAFLKRTDVSIVEIFAPFCYEGIAHQWDMLLVEGFSGPVYSRCTNQMNFTAPFRYQRGVCSIAWWCGSLTTRLGQHGCVVAEQ